MMKRFLSMFAVLAISLLAACAQVPVNCKNCPPGMDCCGACPCGAVSDDQSTGKMCDPAKKAKHHGKRAHKPAAAVATPAAMKDTKAAPTIPNQEKQKEKSGGMFDGVKKMIQDVQSKDAPKDAAKDAKKPH